MELTRSEIARRASRVRSENARRRRFQRYVREMRAAGLVVEVQTTDFDQPIVHPDYTVEATGR